VTSINNNAISGSPSTVQASISITGPTTVPIVCSCPATCGAIWTFDNNDLNNEVNSNDVLTLMNGAVIDPSTGSLLLNGN